MSTDNNKENKDGIVKANILALQKNSSGLVRRALQDIDVFAANPNLLVKPITKINPIDGAEMVWVPGGTFTMGSPDGVGEENEHPAHQVTLSGYWIYKYEVTVAQYRKFCTSTGYALPPFPEPDILDEEEDDDDNDNETSEYGSNYSWEGKSGWDDIELQKHPAVNVAWVDCKAYADWARTNLPTEAQWEYAARGPDGRNYPWGGIAISDDPYNGWDETKCANYDNSYSQNISTWPVDSFPAGTSWCGVQDLAGNVLEWCADRYSKDYYKTAPVEKNPTGPKTGDYRVMRGGSWCNGDYDSYFRGACRYGDVGGDGVGFRCAVSIPENEVLTTNLQISESNDNVVKIKQTEQILVKPLPITKINPVDGAEMVWVPGGTFTMGSPDGVGSGYEHPAHQVTLYGYWMYKYPVTVTQYCKFCAITGHKLSKFPKGYSWGYKSGWNDPALKQHPIVHVSWDDCKTYASWAGANLPTEAQWEYAACGPEGRNYPWGGIAISDDLYNGWDKTKCANYENSYSHNISTWPVGSFPEGASWCGAQDLAGNVWEWCADWYGENYYKTAPANNPTGPKKGDCRVLRGGSWYGYGDFYIGNYYDYGYRGASRYGGGPGDFYDGYVGFRCVSPEP